jgi:hypothetical protein
MALAAVAAGCSSGDGGSSATDDSADAGAAALVEGLPGELTINQMQVMGSHNSYHVAPTEEQLVAIAAVDAEGADSLDYGHVPLQEQFTDQGIRQIELDIYGDAEGGLYAEPTGAEPAGYDPAEHPKMLEPGFKVIHIPDIDFSSTCTTFVLCLEEVAAWSEANPGHLPFAVLVEAKSDATYAEPFTAASFDALDEEIRSVFGEDQILTPDDVRGDGATLEEAVLEDGWPTLEESQGQVLFMLDNEGEERDAYLEGHPSLEGRVLFASGEPGDDYAAFMKRNDSVEQEDEIRGLIEDGYLVRTRADEPTVQARTGDTTLLDAALASGATWVSTDFPVPGLADRYGSDYVAQLPDGVVARCNPVSAPDDC